MKEFSVKNVVAIGVGSALFFILARFVAIPTPIPNTTLQVTYSLLTLISFVFGPITGALVGLIGHTITDMLSYGAWWSWIIASGFFGLAMGFVGQWIGVEDFNGKKIVKFLIASAVVCVITWGFVAPLLDILIYQEPVNKVFTQGLASGISNYVMVAVLGTLLIKGFGKTLVKEGSLSKDN